MASDLSWSIDGTVANGCSSPPVTLTRGSTPRFRFWFGPDPALSDDYTTRHADVLEFLEYANGAPIQTGTTDRGVPWYREKVPAAAPVETFVIALEPGDAIERAAGLWGVVVGGQDATTPAGDRRWVELEVFVLAEHSEYADTEAVESEFGSRLL